MKTCSKCNETKSLDCFQTRKLRGKQYVLPNCKECETARKQEWKEQNVEKVDEWKEANKEKLVKQRKAHYEKNKDKELSMSAKWKEGNKEQVLESARAYAKAHKAERNAAQQLRHAKKVSASLLDGDEWNDFVISEIYDLRKTRSIATGIEWHVDHVIPLQGKTVSGLHVWNNLQLIPAKLNLQKKNKF